MGYSFLALGDSYTVGEGVDRAESFPLQAVSVLRAAGHSFSDPVILARTGWTTGELTGALQIATAGKAVGEIVAKEGSLRPPYDVVTLLIGVNNEYRGLSPGQFERELRDLLRSAINLAGNRPARTFLLSIPDWSVSPFAAIHLPDALGRDRQTVSQEIDLFNERAARQASECGVEFIDITPHSRMAGEGRTDEAWAGTGRSDGGSGGSWFASDGLHPSGRQYRYWAEELAARILAQLGAAQ